jgi:hypothetical protein
MEELGLINDQSYCEAKTQYLIMTKKCSLGETRAKLLTLGINKDIIKSCIALYDSETQADNLRALIEKKYKSKLDNPQKVVAALMRKGFSYYEIKSALKEFEIETEDDIDVKKFMALDEVKVMKKSKSGIKESDIRPFIYELEKVKTEKGIVTLKMCLACGSGYNLKPDTVADAFCKYLDTKISFVSVHRNELIFEK